MSGVDTMGELHWLLSIVQHVDVGLIVVDADHKIKLWNAFMENHSGRAPNDVVGQSLFATIPETPATWLQSKIDSVFLLKNSSFSVWQQRPYVVKLRSYRPLTGRSEWMYQNVTFLPLMGVSTQVEHVCLIIYDVTDMALNELLLRKQTHKDSLTHLLNLQAWQMQLAAEQSRLIRSGTSSVLLMLQIDNFEKLVAKHGHQAGDEMLRSVATLMDENRREPDSCGRIADHRLAMILVDTDEEGAKAFCERLHKAVADTVVTYSHHHFSISVSIGLAESPGLSADTNAWLQKAETALADAIYQGGNRIIAYQDNHVL